jgi:hypothetical protein
MWWSWIHWNLAIAARHLSHSVWPCTIAKMEDLIAAGQLGTAGLDQGHYTGLCWDCLVIITALYCR